MSNNITINTTTENVSLSIIDGSVGGSRWGLIVGTLSAQTDLYSALSALRELSYTNFLVLSSGLDTTNTFLTSNSGYWSSTYTSVNVNSGYWQDSYTNLIANSAAYLSATDLSFLSVSGNWNDSYTWVSHNSANASFQTISAISLSGTFFGDGSNLIGASLPGQADINTVVGSASGNWNGVYTTVNSNSATTWNYQGLDLKSLSSGWVGGNNAYTNLTLNSAAYLSSVDLNFLSVSGNWNSVYTTVGDSSASWMGGNEAYTILVSNSSAYIATPVYGTEEQIVAAPGANNSVTIGLPISIVTPGDLNVTGSLFINGTAANINSTNISLSDSLIYLGEGNISNVIDIGFVGNFSPAPSAYQHTGLVRVARDNKWTLFSGVTAEPTTVVEFSGGYVLDTLRANIEGTIVGNVSGNISGNAETVTNGVYTNQSYTDPSWIASIDDTKITGSKFALQSAQVYQVNTGTNSIQPISGSNTASGYASIVSGGYGNTASEQHSTVIGGFSNMACGGASIAGGYDNTASGYGSVAFGGQNTASGGYSITASGRLNIASGSQTTVSGGYCNTASGCYASVAGGRNNTASGDYSSILGGNNNNTNNQSCSFIIGQGIIASQPNYTYVNNISSIGVVEANGGNSDQWNNAYNISTEYQNASGSFATNTALDNYQTSVAASTATLLPTSIYQNTSGSFVTLTNGDTRYSRLSSTAYIYNSSLSAIVPVVGSNTVSGVYSNVLGGRLNRSLGVCTVVAGGNNNCAGSTSPAAGHVAIVGGDSNCTVSCASFIGGGCLNKIQNAAHGVIGGGLRNEICGPVSNSCGSFVGSGNTNCLYNGQYSSIVGGITNRITGANCSSIIGGINNSATLGNTFILGSNLTTPLANFTYVNNLSSQGVVVANPLRVGNSLAATGPVGTITGKVEIFNAAGTSLGFIPVYSSIT